MQKHASVLGSAVSLGLLAIVFVVLDWSYAVSLSGQLLAMMLILVLALGLPITLITGDWHSLMPLGGCLLFVLALPFIPLSPVKAFHGFFERVNVGMTKQEVLKQLDLRFPQGGRFTKPRCRQLVDQSMLFVLDPNDGRYDSETVTVVFHDGHVLAKMYLPD
jgi:hypothetical protein